jgi:hypothetical protein
VIAVVRKHLVIALMILPCSDESAFSCDAVGAVCVSLGLGQMIAPWSIQGAATAVKSRLRYLNLGPHLLFAIPAIASPYLVPLATICETWERNLRFRSKVTPKYFASELGWIVVPPIVIVASTLADVFRVKYIRTYLDFSN